MKYLKVSILILTLFCLLHLAQSTPTVTINRSKITGRTVSFLGTEAHQYLGLPYAVPPVGPLRFKRPVPYTRYPKEFDAIKNPNACTQYIKDPFPWAVNTTEMGEDCLYLNIWTPAEASRYNRKAVFFWIHGGSWKMGSIRAEAYDGTRLAVLGDVIVVTVNYRLGYFGFLTSKSEDAPGNAGVYDVLEGLRWVNKNIAAFGGDVSRITIAGESAGSVDTGLLAISPLAKGLFTRHIMHSAAPTYRTGDNNTQNLAYSQQLAKYLGCADESYTIGEHPKAVLKCLRDIDASVISKADYDLAPREVLTLVPEWGDEILPNNPRDSVLKGNFECTDLLIGTNKDEGSFLITTYSLQDQLGFFGEKNAHVDRQTGQAVIRNSAVGFPDVESIVDHYLPLNLTDNTDYQIRSQVNTASGDMLIVCPTVYYAEQCADQGRNVYYYHFTHRPSVSPWAPWTGVVHFDEIQFLYGRPIFNPDYQIVEYELSKQIIDIWSSFVKYGKPNIPWPLYSGKNRTYKILGPGIVTGRNGENGPHSENCDFLRPLFR